jgi:hypothetical protein
MSGEGLVEAFEEFGGDFADEATSALKALGAKKVTHLRVGEVEIFFGASHTHVAETTLFLKLFGVVA